MEESRHRFCSLPYFLLVVVVIRGQKTERCVVVDDVAPLNSIMFNQHDWFFLAFFFFLLMRICRRKKDCLRLSHFQNRKNSSEQFFFSLDICKRVFLLIKRKRKCRWCLRLINRYFRMRKRITRKKNYQKKRKRQIDPNVERKEMFRWHCYLSGRNI